MNNHPLITLLTDFGTSDAYVGTMKGVMLSICPTAQFVDLTHTIRAQDIRQAAYVLLTAYRYFPPRTIFLVIVDPGVGTAREPIAVETPQGSFIAPNNGVLSYVLAEQPILAQVTLSNPHYRLNEISPTFHGRDIFSPAAAYLANGIPIKRLGPPLDTLVQLPAPRLIVGAETIEGEVLHIDHFGNIITSIGHMHWQPDSPLLQFKPRFGPTLSAARFVHTTSSSVTLGSQTLSVINRTYGDVPSGQITALIGSSGQLEIGINQGNAAHQIGAQIGDPVILHGVLEQPPGSKA